MSMRAVHGCGNNQIRDVVHIIPSMNEEDNQQGAALWPLQIPHHTASYTTETEACIVAGLQAVSQTEREELFSDFRHELERRDKEEKRRQRAVKSAAFRELLVSTRGIKLDTPWRKVAPKLEGEPAHDDLDRADRLEVFADYIRCASSPQFSTLESMLLPGHVVLYRGEWGEICPPAPLT